MSSSKQYNQTMLESSSQDGSFIQHGKGDFIVVLDLDMTLVYSTPFKPDDQQDPNQSFSYVKVKVTLLINKSIELKSARYLCL